MPSVGSVSFDVMTGLPQSYLTPSIYKAVQAACLAIGMKNPESPREDGGDIETTVKKADEAACIDMAADCRAIVGYVVTITVDAGATVTNQFISSVDCQWRRVGGFASPNFYVFTAKWKLVPIQETDNSGNDTTTLAEVWICKPWGQWVRHHKLRCFGAAEGCGSYAGECDFVQKLGMVGGQPEDELDILGRWVEIRAKSEVNSIPKPIWWGVVSSKTLTGTESGPEVNFHCVGLVDVLRQCQLNRWYELRNGTTVIDPGSVLPFNNRPAGDTTTNSTFDLGGDGGGAFRIHDRARANGVAWKASDIVKTALEAMSVQYPGGPIWTLSGQTSALDYIFSGGLEFASMFDILQACISPSRSLFFTVSVPLSGSPRKSGQTVNIEISTGLPVAVNLPGQGNPAPAAIVIPAAFRTDDVDLTPTEVKDWSISQDDSDLYDTIFIQAPRPLNVTTLGFPSSDVNTAPDSISETCTATSQLTKDWSNAEETAWLAADDKTRNQSNLVHVFRRYRLRALWKGGPYHATSTLQLPIARQLDGNGNETGNWSPTDSEWPDARTIKLSRSLPIPAGKDWSVFGTGYTVTDLKHTDPPEKLQAFQVDGVTWRAIHDLYEIWVNGGSSIEIGRNARDGLAIKALLEDGKDMVFTVGYEWPLPWRVSWRRSKPELTGNAVLTPRDLARSLIIPLSGDMNTWRRIDRQCVVRLDGNSVKRTNAGVDVYKPGTIYQALELAKTRYTMPRRSLSWTLNGEVEMEESFRPGLLIKSADVPYGARSSKKTTVNAVLTRRSWSFVTASPSTSYSAEPTLPEIDSVIHMGVGANGPAGGGFPGGVYQ